MSGDTKIQDRQVEITMNPREQLAKFGIGVFGGLCAAFVPRMTTVISSSDPVIRDFAIFDSRYAIIAVVLSLITGFAVVFARWTEPCRPAAVFWAAVAMPAVIASSANMTNFEPYYVQLKTGSELAEFVQNSERIEQYEIRQFPETTNRDNVNYENRNDNRTLFFKSALAGQNDTAIDRAIVVAQSNLFQVIVGPFKNENEAKQALDWLRESGISPNGITVRSTQNTYFVLHSQEGALRPQATLTAAGIKSSLRENSKNWAVGMKPAQ